MTMDCQRDSDRLLDLCDELRHCSGCHHADCVWYVNPVDARVLNGFVHLVKELELSPSAVLVAELDDKTVILAVLHRLHGHIYGLVLRDLQLLLKMSLRGGQEYVYGIDIAGERGIDVGLACPAQGGSLGVEASTRNTPGSVRF